MGFRWRSEASFRAMNLRRSVSVKRMQLYRESRASRECVRVISAGDLAVPRTPQEPGPRLPAGAHRAAQFFGLELYEQPADGGSRRDVQPREDVASGNGRAPAARGGDPPGAGPGAGGPAGGEERQA